MIDSYAAQTPWARRRDPASSAGGRPPLAIPEDNPPVGDARVGRQHPAPADEEPACSTAPSTACPCLAKTPPPSVRARESRRSRSQTVRFLYIDGEVAPPRSAVRRCSMYSKTR
jgi:hypothetical protein